MNAGIASTCPWLGMIGDPATRYEVPSDAQVCHATRRPSEITADKQARDCLTAWHISCSRYRPVTSPATTVAATTVAEPSSHPAGIRSRLIRLAILVLLTVVVVTVGFITGAWLASGS